MTQESLKKSQMDLDPASIDKYVGAILTLQGDVLQGWALNTGNLEIRPVVEIFIDGASVALVRADQYEPLAPMGDQFHGFIVQLRNSWLNEARFITARIANQEIDLSGHVQLPFSSSGETSTVTTQIWHTGGLRVGGWAWDPQSPKRHVEVTVREGDKIICTATCNVHNQALAYRETSDHGLAIDLPWDLADGKVHVLDIVNDMGQPLAGSPIRVCCRPEGMEGVLRKLGSARECSTLSLLTEMAREQAMRLPNSVGWQHYPQWFEVFQRLDHCNRPTVKGKIGLLIISAGDPELEKISLASLGEDISYLHYHAAGSIDNIRPTVQELITAGCDRILPIFAGDRIASNALPHFSTLLDDENAWGFVDCDQDDQNGGRDHPWLKPAWDIDIFISTDIYMQGAIFSAEILEKALAQLLHSDKDTFVNWHLLSASVALITERNKGNVSHLSRVLYHRASNLPVSPEQAPVSLQRLRAIQWLCENIAPRAMVDHVQNYPSLLQAHWPLPVALPKVSLIVPTRDQFTLLHTCIEGLLSETEYPDLEIIIIDNQSSDPQTLTYLSDLTSRGVKVISHPYPFNYSTINNRAVHHAKGEIIGLVNNDIEIIDNTWLKEMVAQLLRPTVGAVGAKLLWPNRMVQHGGVVVGVNGLAAHIGNNLAETDPGYLATNQITRRQSAVTAACLLVRKVTFEQVGGLDENAFPVAFNDVDFCLKIRALELDVIWCASAKLIHAESASRGKDQTPEKRARALREQENFIRKWGRHQSDPYYHPALSLDYISGPYGGLAIPANI